MTILYVILLFIPVGLAIGQIAVICLMKNGCGQKEQENTHQKTIKDTEEYAHISRITEITTNALQAGACKLPCRKIRSMPPEEMDSLKDDEIERALVRAIDVEELTERWKPDNVQSYIPKPNIDAVYGAIYGDIAGSRYEFTMKKPEEYTLPPRENNERYRATDDTVLTIATAESLIRNVGDWGSFTNITDTEHILKYSTLSGKMKDDFAQSYKTHGNKHRHAGYGRAFFEWLENESVNGYGSRGNGSAMRISPIGAMGLPYEQTVLLAIQSTACTHDNIEGVRGAVAEAVAVWMACAGASKERIFEYIQKIYRQPGLNMFHDFTLSEAAGIRYHQVECPFSVPASIIAVHESSSFTDGIMKAMKVGMDADTNACIAGAVLGPLYGITDEIKDVVREKLDEEQRAILDDMESTLKENAI